jgi:hypothetical protein
LTELTELSKFLNGRQKAEEIFDRINKMNGIGEGRKQDQITKFSKLKKFT